MVAVVPDGGEWTWPGEDLLEDGVPDEVRVSQVGACSANALDPSLVTCREEYAEASRLGGEVVSVRIVVEVRAVLFDLGSYRVGGGIGARGPFGSEVDFEEGSGVAMVFLELEYCVWSYGVASESGAVAEVDAVLE